MAGGTDFPEEEKEPDSPPPHPDLHLIPTPTITSWNPNSLSYYRLKGSGWARRGNIVTNLLHLKRSSDIICIQETHLKRNEMTALDSVFRGWSRFYNNADGRQGTMIIISPKYTRSYSCASLLASP